MKVLILDAMGVIYQAGDDVAELLVPFICDRTNICPAVIEELYHKCSLGEFSSSSFWQKVGLDISVEDEYLNGHKLIDGVKEFIGEAKEYFDSIWCLSNDVSEWSIKLRQKHNLEPLFDGFVISGNVHSRKPAKEIYEALFSLSGAKPNEVIFIDDRPQNVITAMDLNMESILFGSQQGVVGDLRLASDFSELKSMLIAQHGDSLDRRGLRRFEKY